MNDFHVSDQRCKYHALDCYLIQKQNKQSENKEMDVHAGFHSSDESLNINVSISNESDDSENYYEETFNVENKEQVLTEFGKPDENYHWIECQSKTYPGEKYYYNLKTFCNTWIRPVSRFVNIPRFNPISSKKIADQQSTTESLIGVSEINYPTSRQRQPLKIDNQIEWLTEGKKEIFKRYYCSVDITESDHEEELIDPETQLKSLQYWGNWRFGSPRGHLPSKTIVLPSEQSNTTDDTDEDEILFNNNNDNLSSTESSCPCCRNVSAPRLKPIETSDLLIKQINTRKNARPTTKKQTEKDLKIVCEMYGTTTINYNQTDFDSIIQKKLNWKVSKLSDSGSDDPLGERNIIRTTNQRDFVINISSPSLSEMSDTNSSW